MRRVLLSLAAAMLSACGGGASPPPGPELSLSVGLDAAEVTPGKAFPLTVVVAWDKGLAPPAWDDRLLAPLVLRAEGTSHLEDEKRVEETRRYRAYAFSREEVTIPPPRITARATDGGAPRTALADGITLRVRPEVDAAEPGPPELPGEPPPEPSPRWPFVAALATALAAAAVFLVARARRRVPPAVPVAAPAAPTVDPAARALARLESLRSHAPAEAVAEIAEVLRGWAVESLRVPAFERTTEEVGAGRPALARLLAPADAVKFAAAAPTEPERDRLLDDASALVRASARGDAP